MCVFCLNLVTILLLYCRYDVALDINTGGPSRLINFARKCHKIKLFVQISTGK